jgi:release factor glutamine methyltransferase
VRTDRSRLTAEGCRLGELHDEIAGLLGGDRGGARDVLAAVLDKPRTWPAAHGDEGVESAAARRARAAAGAIRAGMPLAYAVGTAAFRHLTLRVDRRVLIPRPETELLVDLALTATGGHGVVADIGTGSGAIALSLAAEGGFDRVFATDISADALAVAAANLDTIPADRRRLVEFRRGDLTDAIAGERVAAVVSNPPYIANPERADLPASVRDWEPPLSLFGGDDGMVAIQRLVAGAAGVVVPGGYLLMEVDSRRAVAARHLVLATGAWQDAQVHADLTGRDRFVTARRTTFQTD